MYKICVVKGDGIGVEVADAALRVLDAVRGKLQCDIEVIEQPIGGHAYDLHGDPLPQCTLDAVDASHAVLLGAVGGPKWKDVPTDKRPEAGLLALRKHMGCYANLRPCVMGDALVDLSSLKPDVVKGTDVLIVRELLGGMYFGKNGRFEKNGEVCAYDEECYSVSEVERVAHVAFQHAQSRRKHVTNVDKANVLESSRLWRETVDRVAKQYPDVTVEHMYVDNASMQLLKRPTSFDVLLTSNMFGDILSDEAAMVVGGIGTLPSASLGSSARGLYEPIHGSAPDIAGKGIANPMGTMRSLAMLLRHSLNESVAADAIENAIDTALNNGVRTVDLGGTCDTATFTSRIVEFIELCKA